MANTIPEPVILDSLNGMVFRAMSVLAGKQLDLFTPLKNGPLSAGQLATSLGVEEAKLRPLLCALVVVGLLTFENGFFANTPEADYYLVRGGPHYWEYCHLFFSNIWSAALHIAESIRTGKPQAAHDYTNMGEAELEEFISSMHSVDGGTWFAQNYEFSAYKTVLDAGGGSGGVAIGLAEALPHLQVTVADLPSVTKTTRHFVARAGVADRVRVQEVDIVRQPITGSFDAAILRFVLHVVLPEEAYQTVLNVHQALRPGGTIYVMGVIDDSYLAPEDSTMWGPVFTALYQRGDNITVQECREIITKAGFEDFKLDANRVITARKPAHIHSTDIHTQ